MDEPPFRENAGIEDFGIDDAGIEDAGIPEWGIENAGIEDFGIENAGIEDFGIEVFGTENVGMENRGIEVLEKCELLELLKLLEPLEADALGGVLMEGSGAAGAELENTVLPYPDPVSCATIAGPAVRVATTTAVRIVRLISTPPLTEAARQKYAASL